MRTRLSSAPHRRTVPSASATQPSTASRTDASGNSTDGTFTVYVRSAAEQLQSLPGCCERVDVRRAPNEPQRRSRQRTCSASRAGTRRGHAAQSTTSSVMCEHNRGRQSPWTPRRPSSIRRHVSRPSSAAGHSRRAPTDGRRRAAGVPCGPLPLTRERTPPARSDRGTPRLLDDEDMTRLGWIGTGVMGASMCGHVLDAGYAVTVTDAHAAKADALVERGAAWADTPPPSRSRATSSSRWSGTPPRWRRCCSVTTA